jgi:glycosyltransferase involved in cell wall biosynthesis
VKLLIIDSHTVQYRVPIYRELAKLLQADGGRLSVVYGSDSSVRGAMDTGFGQNVTWDEPMLEGYDHEFLPGANRATPGGFRSITGVGISDRILALRPDAIFINGINYEMFVRAIFTSRTTGIPTWIRSETQDSAFTRSRWKAAVRSIIYRFAYSQIAHFFPIGALNAKHYRSHGVPASRLTRCNYCVVDRFQADPEILDARRKAMRRSLGILDAETVIMFSGKLIEKKYPAVLIEAWNLLPEAKKGEFRLLFVGSGEQECFLRDSASSTHAPAIFVGFVNQSEIADYYLASDAVILPSRQMGETWGLVANEGMMAGKPVILSKHAGSSEDFRHLLGVQVVDPTPAAIANAFQKLDQMPSGAVIRDQTKDYTIEAAAAAIHNQCTKV